MSTYQTTYAEKQAIGLPGQVPTTEPGADVSRTVESAAGIAFGQPAFRGSADNTVKVYAAGAVFLGIAKLTPAVPADTVNPDKYPQNFTGAFRVTGPMYVVAGGNVAAGGKVYWDSATGKYVADNTKVEIPATVFDTSGAANDVVKIVLKDR